MFELTIDAVLLSQLLNVLRTCVSGFCLRCDEKELSAQAMEKGNVAVIALNLKGPDQAFYRCDVAKGLGLLCVPLHAAVSDASLGDMVTLRKADEDDMLTVDLTAKKVLNYASYRTYEVPLDAALEAEKESVALPVDQVYPCEVVLKASRFFHAINYTHKFGGQVQLNMTKKQCWLNVTTDQETIEIYFSPVSIRCSKDISMGFHQRLLYHVAKLHHTSEEVTVSMAPGQPLRLRYGLTSRGTGEGREVGTLLFYLAPFVPGEEGDDEDEEEGGETEMGEGGDAE